MNEKIKINNNAFVYPMPMILIGVEVSGKNNFMPVGWVSRVNAAPPMIAVAMGKNHHTNKGIREHKVFSINIPGSNLIKETDRCGLTSGQKIDKTALFTLFYGDLEKAPMIKECTLNMECKLLQTIELPTNEVFIAEIVNAYSEERYLTDGKPDAKKLDPFTLTMPDNNYWKIGDFCGKAWNIGKEEK